MRCCCHSLWNLALALTHNALFSLRCGSPHLSPRRLERGTGRIPRYLNLRFEPTGKDLENRSFQPLLAKSFLTQSIKLTVPEKLIRVTGSRASKYVPIRHPESDSRKQNNLDLAYLLQRMAPISSKLNPPICPVWSYRESLEYSPKHVPVEGLDEVTPTLEAAFFCQEASWEKIELGIHWIEDLDRSLRSWHSASKLSQVAMKRGQSALKRDPV